MSLAPAGHARLLRVLMLMLLGLALGGCATAPAGGPPNADPWESANRKIFDFNEALDEATFKPAAEAYQAIVPQFMRTGITNFFGNLADAWTSTNLLLQAKPRQSLEMGMRTLVNTFFGLGGVLDWASEMGLERQTVEDAGQTLGYWGIPSGPYVMLPLLGPSTLRDSAGLLVDYRRSSINRVFEDQGNRNVAGALNLLQTREGLLGAGRVFDQIALDKYLLLRDTYLARRRSQLYDGDPPEDGPGPAPYKSLLPLMLVH